MNMDNTTNLKPYDPTNCLWIKIFYWFLVLIEFIGSFEQQKINNNATALIIYIPS